MSGWADRLALATLALSAAIGCGQSRSSTPGSADAPAGAGPVASVERAEGDVRYRAARAGSWTPAQPRQPLQAADRVQTMTDARASLRFARNGALASLGPSTTLRIPDQPPDVSRFAHLSGSLVARVERRDHGARMEVELPPGTLVLEIPERTDGTDEPVEAQLSVHDERTEIAVTEGRARLDRHEGEPLDVEADHFVTVADDGSVLEAGRSGARVTLASPAEGAQVRTRRAVRFAWTPIDGAERYRLEVTGEDGERRTFDVEEPEAEVDLPTGTFTWTARGLAGAEPLPVSAPRALAVELDRRPPPLTLTAPRPGEVVRGPLVVHGRTEPGARVEVDGESVPVAADGHFESRRTVARGLVNVVVRTSDALGNTRVVSRSVLRE